MALIHNETFDIIAGTNIEDGEGAENEYFEVDDLIAMPIALLNKKGYRTIACCSGHPFDNISEIICNNADDCKNLPYLVKEGPKTGGYQFVQRFDDNSFYIFFDNDYFVNCDLTGNFYFDDFNCIRHEYNTKNYSFDKIYEIVDNMKSLYQWVEKLPDLLQP
ncbi:MAG: hypothetical protein LBT43_21840 [Prevotella sp.]|jgi:hypothetical protein|uniref:hypothetical protein n=1 Tax=Clostridium sp. NkU-1 TaxID=1095009 RepID=UPI0006D1AEED|nr:hypothetical protein [Prevotella sp.]